VNGLVLKVTVVDVDVLSMSVDWKMDEPAFH
jgi:hypothetical protein